MINLAKLEYRVQIVLRDGTQLDVTNLTTGLGFSEGKKELAAKIQMKLANAAYQGGTLFEQIQPMTPIFIYANARGDFEEVMRGNVAKLELTETNGEFNLALETNDEAQALRHNQDDYYFSPDSSSTSILEKILSDHGVPHEIQIEDAAHAKKIYRAKNLSDMIADVLKDLKEKTGKFYFVRAKEGVVQIIERGTNSEIYHFDADENLMRIKESFDASKTVTQVKIVGMERKETKPAVQGVVTGRNDLGTRQAIYHKAEKETAAEAETAAKNILKEKGGIERKTSIEAADLPFLRKGDRIRIRSSTGTGYFFISTISHNAVTQRMTAELDFDKDFSESQGLPIYDLNYANEYDASAPS